MERRVIAYGDAGVETTLNAMGDLIDGGVDNPVVVGFARQLVTMAGGDAGRDQYRCAATIAGWLGAVWRFVDDPLDRELLRDADAMLREYAATGVVMGDCDEAAVLGGTLGKAVGLGVALTALGFDASEGPAPFVHVYAVLLTDDESYVSLDVTKPRGPVPLAVRSLTIDL